MDKLSELSKPVAYDYQIAGACIADGHNTNGQWVHWSNELRPECPPDWMIEEGQVKDLKPRYSQEYVSALLAELGAKDKRIAELERSLTDAGRERDDWVDHSSKMERRAIEAERKLATPIVAPDDGFDDCREMRPDSTNDFDTGYNFGLYRYEQNIRAAGFTVEGDE